ncbi:hypothetical protein MRB53_036956 [Persea americana]|nr:hypothetical protein MRB53_036956 [Persea americana]
MTVFLFLYLLDCFVHTNALIEIGQTLKKDSAGVRRSALLRRHLRHESYTRISLAARRDSRSTSQHLTIHVFLHDRRRETRATLIRSALPGQVDIGEPRTASETLHFCVNSRVA